MRITAYGTRGGTPIARPGIRYYGGNTTCLRVHSTCLPAGTALLIDAGTGIVPASFDLLAEGIRRIVLLMTHYHHDHTLGFPLAPHTFEKAVPIDIYGPHEHGIGPRKVFQALMSAPFFPVDYALVAGHITCHDLDAVGTDALVIHPQDGVRRAESGQDAPQECLVVRTHRAVHPGCTVSYRFEERPTGKVAVLLTDHENTEALLPDLRRHVSDADLLIQDAQYTRAQYRARTAGFGHGTGDHAARVMKECNVGRLGLTHHDPMADDPDVEAIVGEARTWLADNGAADRGDAVFACADYQVIEV
jgi:ribonuclease BN (tRNA processing enzyme)